MYIELFLIDNFVMNMLIIKLSGAISGITYSKLYAISVCIFQSVYAVFAVNNSLLCILPFKIILCFIFTLPFFVKGKTHILAQPVLIFISTLVLGGAGYAFLAANCAEGSIWSKLIIPAIFGIVIIRGIRLIKKESAKAKFNTNIVIEHNGQRTQMEAILDSGSTLCEFVTGKPVVIVYAPELKKYAKIPVCYADTASTSRSVLAFEADSVLIGDKAVDVLIAPVCKNPSMKAVVPYFAVMDNSVRRY